MIDDNYKLKYIDIEYGKINKVNKVITDGIFINYDKILLNKCTCKWLRILIDQGFDYFLEKDSKTDEYKPKE